MSNIFQYVVYVYKNIPSAGCVQSPICIVFITLQLLMIQLYIYILIIPLVFTTQFWDLLLPIC